MYKYSRNQRIGTVVSKESHKFRMRMHSSAILLLVASAVFAVPHQNLSEWEQFKLAHNKMYDAEEEAQRHQIFSENLKKIEEHNALHAVGLKTYKMGVNQFADMTAEEFKNYLTMSGSNPLLKSEGLGVFEAPAGIELPASVDYRKKNAVNPVKNQGSCGSCWAFSTVGALESINFLKTGKLLSLSEQNLVDCSGSYGNNGCNGGLMEAGYNYIKDNGIETEKEYPYKAYDSYCKFKKAASVLKVKGHTNVQQGSEKSLQAAVATVGPIAVAVDASEWQFYSGGIFSTSGSYQLNHGVVAVGYGTQNGRDYWIVRNSWGPSWGEAGYIRVARNANNQVGISDMACYPNL